MKSANMSTANVMKRENVSSSANVLMCKQWWKVCWMYGDQEKYYRQLYGKRPTNNSINNQQYENGTTPTVTQSVRYENFIFASEYGTQQMDSTGVMTSQYLQDLESTATSGLNSLELPNGNNE